MLIREGGYYRARNGNVWGPLVDEGGDPMYPWTVSYSGMTWTKWGAEMSKSEGSNDLISEVYVSDTPPEPHQAPIPEREAEYRKVLLDVAMRLWTLTTEGGGPMPHKCFHYADVFLAELKRRDGGE